MSLTLNGKFTKPPRHPLLRYGVGVFSVALIFLLRLLINPFVTETTPFLLFLIAVMVSAWYGGMGPGLMATVLSTLISDFVFLSPYYGFLRYTPGQTVQLSLFILEGSVITALTVALHSAKRQAEANMEAARRSEETRRQSEERFRLLIDGARDYAIFMLDASGQVISWNAGTERLQGYQAEEILGKPISHFYLPEQIRQGRPDKALRIAATEGRFEEEDWRMRKDGSIFWALMVVTALRDASGGLSGYSVVMRDITERKRAEEERNDLLIREQKARLEAEEANRSKDEFLAMVSHELRTPLNAILGYSQLLGSGMFDEAQAARAIESIERNAKIQVQLIEDLLDVSRIITGKLRLHPRPIDLIEVIEAAVDTVRPAADAKGIRLESDLDPSAAPFVGDPDRLQQVTWNLISNAVKFTPEGGEVRVGLKRIPPYVALTVSDTGIGIPPDFLPFVFERFRQGASSPDRSHTGLGLGLSIVRHLAELHGGSVQATSEGAGRGATFTVKLPVRAIRTGGGNLPRSEEAPSTMLEGIKVLVVDDEADARDLVTLVLKQRKAEVAAVGSAEEARRALDSLKPDVLVSDIAMPGIDGYVLIGRLRQEESEGRRHIPAVALTAYGGFEDRQQALMAGFDTYLVKPVDPERLAKALSALARSIPS
ncbi:hybrid sensor histidine kinase/response regulator [Candidatus Manganitrophus noduliformans]|uniref:histidine kinase n=1 Tax=Candidatus Manganitrophus noduliformans TaxID=2606439 RepID=A0A7X6DT93_9BACT|nr:ATP-binding protein [Candidatus Manganitrophus noduliformans]NKE72618.1 PAS domain S-box protein [Candidatus Manganitrophus noduliformans]